MSAAASEHLDVELEALRAEVAEADRALLSAFNRRVELVQRIRTRKLERGIVFVDPAQEARLLDALAVANRGPVSQAGVRELFGVVLALTKREVARAAHLGERLSGDGRLSAVAEEGVAKR